ncbi:MAG: hypothetical protein A2289_20000 [Deltaproteobacteria bacterium RIFOXYA12_FULL_58_15]|nr:MAG: hypothetical protein A2289_20000 [Deltaproteobacteria bacterium RIFOXYA12_FULL_58_15]OGR07135.1 MAG: hypothetical protein A2341_03295 [Deltaproteobacteria bacterium RIFOXYB12_FULL_58_9]
MLNLAGGESVNDIDVLERDAGFAAVFRQFRMHGFKAYQPLNIWWAEQQLVVRSEFRDGNVVMTSLAVDCPVANSVPKRAGAASCGA